MQSQKAKLFNLLSDYQPHSTIEILNSVYGLGHSGIARIGARIADIKAEGHQIEGWKDKTKSSIYWYQLKRKEPIQDRLFTPSRIN